MIHHISLFLCKSAEPIPCLFSSFLQSFSSALSQQQEHIATSLHCPCFSVERINSYQLILFNGHKSNTCFRQKFLRQKINSSQIKVGRFQWTPSLSGHILRSTCTFSFRSSRAFFLNIFSEAAASSLKK